MKSYELGLVFTGHMIDASGRKEPRFPATMYEDVKESIRKSLRNAWHDTDGEIICIASAAKGADIIFLEVAQHLGLDTMIVLPRSIEEFIKGSIGEPDQFCWERRMKKVIDGAQLFTALAGNGVSSDYTDANNLMAQLAMDHADKTKLLAFWDGNEGGVGGTGEFSKSFHSMGGEIEVIDAAFMLKDHLYRLAEPTVSYE
jgi:hypothetical protein